MDDAKEFRERDHMAIDRVLTSIRNVWIKNPTWRLGQLIVSAVNPPDMCPKLFGMGDERLIQHIQSFGQMLGGSPSAAHK